MHSRRPGPIHEPVRITTVGLCYLLFLLSAALIPGYPPGAVALTGLLLALLVVSELTSRLSLRSIEVRLLVPTVVHANCPFEVRVEIFNRSRWMPSGLLLVSSRPSQSPVLLVPLLPSGGRTEIPHRTLLLTLRGRRSLPAVTLFVSSLFPLGFFRRGNRYILRADVLVLPELALLGTVGEREDSALISERFADPARLFSQQPGPTGGDSDSRGFTPAPTVRWTETVPEEPRSSPSERVSILVDESSASGAPDFELLVSFAATAAVSFLERGSRVELVTRGGTVPFGFGSEQRSAILRRLACLEPVSFQSGALTPIESTGRALIFALSQGEAT